MSAPANTGNPVFRPGRYPGNGRGPKSVRKLEGIADPSDGDRDCRSPLDNTGACFALGFKLTHYRPRRWLRNVRRAAAASGWNKPAPQ